MQVGKILARYGRNRQYLVPILQDIQEECRYLPREALEEVAEGLGVPLIRVYGAATFYKAFSLTPRGKHLVQVCVGTACHVRQSSLALEAVERALGVKAGETTGDGKYSVESVNCLGVCAMGPVMAIDDEYYGNLTPAKVAAIFKRLNKADEGRKAHGKTAKRRGA